MIEFNIIVEGVKVKSDFVYDVGKIYQKEVAMLIYELERLKKELLDIDFDDVRIDKDEFER